MLLRVRVTLPDRPGSLGQVARTLGVSGADIVQVVVLERMGGRAVDDFTVVWPGASRVERLLDGLAAVPGVRVDGMWTVAGAPVAGGLDAQLLAQVAGNPDDGLATLVDAVPVLLAADWAVVLAVPADWADRNREWGRAAGRRGASVVRASWQAPEALELPEVSPLRARPLTGPGGVHYAVAPLDRAGLVLLVARVPAEQLPPAAFHATEVDRLGQLVRAAAVVLGDRLDRQGDLERLGDPADGSAAGIADVAELDTVTRLGDLASPEATAAPPDSLSPPEALIQAPAAGR